MKKRDSGDKKEKSTKTKVIDNQMFDFDGNLLSSVKNSFNHSLRDSRAVGSEFVSTVLGGPQCAISPLINARKMPHDD